MEDDVAPETVFVARKLGKTYRTGEVEVRALHDVDLEVARGEFIERWGGPGTLAGRVRRIEPAAFTKVSALGVEEQRVRVLIDIVSPPEQWRHLGDGFRVGVRIVTLALDNVVKVPVSAVFPIPRRDDSGAGAGAGMAVFAIEDGAARLVPVSVGARNGVDAWVQRGVSAGASVIVYPPATVSDGARVKIRKV